jgi:magnesium-transporting ATPase (P-type)
MLLLFEGKPTFSYIFKNLKIHDINIHIIGMLCRQRQTSLMMLRNMRRPPITLYVYRCKKWDLQSSESLVPGDIISLVSSIQSNKG